MNRRNRVRRTNVKRIGNFANKKGRLFGKGGHMESSILFVLGCSNKGDSNKVLAKRAVRNFESMHGPIKTKLRNQLLLLTEEHLDGRRQLKISNGEMQVIKRSAKRKAK